jgi:hypothetical protein
VTVLPQIDRYVPYKLDYGIYILFFRLSCGEGIEEIGSIFRGMRACGRVEL